MDWTGVLDWNNGLLEWNTGLLEWNTGISAARDSVNRSAHAPITLLGTAKKQPAAMKHALRAF